MFTSTKGREQNEMQVTDITRKGSAHLGSEYHVYGDNKKVATIVFTYKSKCSGSYAQITYASNGSRKSFNLYHEAVSHLQKAGY